jgi:hypothetical protein
VAEWRKIEALWSDSKVKHLVSSKSSTSPRLVTSSSHLGLHSLDGVVGNLDCPAPSGGLSQNLVEPRFSKDPPVDLANESNHVSIQSLGSHKECSSSSISASSGTKNHIFLGLSLDSRSFFIWGFGFCLCQRTLAI